jgi:hypothetical protein
MAPPRTKNVSVALLLLCRCYGAGGEDMGCYGAGGEDMGPSTLFSK